MTLFRVVQVLTIEPLERIDELETVNSPAVIDSLFIKAPFVPKEVSSAPFEFNFRNITKLLDPALYDRLIIILSSGKTIKSLNRK